MAEERGEYVSDVVVFFWSMVSDQVFSLENMCDHVFLSQHVLVFQANLADYYWGDVKDLVYTKPLEEHSVGYG
jgi:hypothetical protein